MKTRNVSRRQFLQKSLTAAGSLALASSPLFTGCAAPAAKRTAVDQVTLGKTGVKLSRLGMGCGSNSGHIQHDLGQQGFNDLVHYAYDQGITYFDCAQTYATFEWMGAAIKPFPREKIFLQSKIPGKPEDILAAIDHHRKIYNTDYIDSLLVHCMITPDWTDQWSRITDGFNTAKDKGWIRAKGVSCHSLPALRQAVNTPWTEVHLVRVNPQGHHVDGEEQSVWNDNLHDVNPVVAQLQKMHADGRGVIGMKIIGNGEFTNPEDREKSVRFAMSRPEIHAVVIGFKDRAEIDEGIERINRALAAA